VEKNVNIPDLFCKMFILCLQFEPELPEEEEVNQEEEEADLEDEAGEDAVPGGGRGSRRLHAAAADRSRTPGEAPHSPLTLLE